MGPFEHPAGECGHRLCKPSFFGHVERFSLQRIYRQAAQDVLTEPLIELAEFGHEHTILVSDVVGRGDWVEGHGYTSLVEPVRSVLGHPAPARARRMACQRIPGTVPLAASARETPALDAVIATLCRAQ